MNLKYRRHEAKLGGKRLSGLCQKIGDFIRYNPGMAIDILCSPEMEFEISRLLIPLPGGNYSSVVLRRWPRMVVSPYLRGRAVHLMVSPGRDR